MKVMGIVFSNLHDKDLGPLTTYRTLASVPFCGRYRLIDFALSNMVNSGISSVGVITKANYQSLMDHIRSGKNWDLSRKNGGIAILPPYGAGLEKVPYSSRLEALKNVSSYIRRSTDDYIVMTDCDCVCNMDFNELVNYHVEKNADITVVYRKQKITTACSKAKIAFDIDKDGKVIGGELSQKLMGDKNIHTNILVMTKNFLLNVLENAKDYNISSFRNDLLINGSKRFNIQAFPLKGYFSSMDNIADYYAHSMALLNKENRDMLFEYNGANIYTKVRDSAPCRLLDDADVSNSLISDGCVIEGIVKNSILARGVKIEKGAVIENSILFQDIVVSRNSRLNCVIADKQVVILEGRQLSGHSTHPYFIAKKSVI